MRLISCHIDQYGKWKNQDFTFSEGMNSIYGENGWGKSTLLSFLCVMFYGFANEGRSIVLSERKKYQPWTGDTFGGSLTFETKGKRYTVFRQFGAKKGSDILEVRDAVTNLPVDSFAGVLGEALFGVDRTSFERTIFVGQQNVTTAPTDGIFAKIGGLSERERDVDGYENAIKILKDLANKLNEKYKKSLCYAQKQKLLQKQKQVLEWQNELAGRDTLLQEQRHLIERQAECKLQLEDNQLAQQRMYEMQQEVGRQKELSAKWRQYAYLRDLVLEKKQVLSERQQQYRLPSEMLWNTYYQEAELLEQEKAQYEMVALSAEQLIRLGELRRQFTPCRPVEIKRPLPELIEKLERDWHTYQVQLQYFAREEEREQLKKAERKRKNKKIGLGLLFLLPGLLTGVFAVEKRLLPLLIVSATLCLTGAICLIWPRKNKMQTGQMAETFEAEAFEASGQELLADENLCSRFESNQSAMQQLAERVRKFLLLYGKTGLRTNWEADLQELGRSWPVYQQLQQQEAQCTQIQTQISNREQCLLQFFKEQEWPIPEHADFQGVFSQMDKIRVLVAEAQKELEWAKEKENHFLETLSEEERNLFLRTIQEEAQQLTNQDSSERFTNQDGSEQFTNHQGGDGISTDALSMEQIVQSNQNLNDELQVTNLELERIGQKMQELDNLAKQVDNCESEIAELEETIAKMKTMQEIGQVAQQALQQAKENLTNRYTAPLMEHFSAYYEIITGNIPEDFFMDANTNLEFMGGSLPRTTEYLSCGMQDLIGFAMRIAYVDAMFEQETPFLLLDDPFVNLDEYNLEGAHQLLECLTENYQILYMTCHKKTSSVV